MKRLMAVLLGAALLITTAAVHSEPVPRIVSVGGEITETLVALGLTDQLAGVDSTSTWPEAVTRLPNVGYSRQLAAEGILSLKPDLILTNHDAGPPQVLDRLRAANVAVHSIETGPGLQEALDGITEIARVVDRQEQGLELVSAVQERIAEVEARLASQLPAPRRALFVLGGSGGQLLVAGGHTRADTVMRLAGAHNAAGHVGYRPVGKEGLLAIDPDLVLVAEHALPGLGGMRELLDDSGLRHTRAGKDKRIFTIDAARTLSMGAGLGDSVAAMAALVYPELKASNAQAPDDG